MRVLTCKHASRTCGNTHTRIRVANAILYGSGAYWLAAYVHNAMPCRSCSDDMLVKKTRARGDRGSDFRLSELSLFYLFDRRDAACPSNHDVACSVCTQFHDVRSSFLGIRANTRLDFTFTLPPIVPPASETTTACRWPRRDSAEKERTDETNDTTISRNTDRHDDHDDDNGDEDNNDNEYTTESGIRVRTKAPRNTERRFMELNYGNERHRA